MIGHNPDPERWVEPSAYTLAQNLISGCACTGHEHRAKCRWAFGVLRLGSGISGTQDPRPRTLDPRPPAGVSVGAARRGTETTGATAAAHSPMKRFLLPTLLSLLVLAVGCARFVSSQTETAPDGAQRVTRVAVTTFFDAHNDLAKLRASTTDKTQTLSVAGLSENASSTNAVAILGHVAAILGAAAK
jgi:hypothetical protein